MLQQYINLKVHFLISIVTENQFDLNKSALILLFVCLHYTIIPTTNSSANLLLLSRLNCDLIFFFNLRYGPVLLNLTHLKFSD